MVYLYHVTTPKKAKRYKQTGKIKGPVRGFDNLMGAMAWAIKAGRKVIYQVTPVSPVYLLPDHHNKWGRAYWTGEVPVENIKCIFSAGDDPWD